MIEVVEEGFVEVGEGKEAAFAMAGRTRLGDNERKLPVIQTDPAQQEAIGMTAAVEK